MRRKSIQLIPIILFFIMLFTIMAKNDTVPAANSTIKIFIGDGTSARHHMSMIKGNTSEEFRFEMKGYKAKSSTYTSNNPAAFQIVNTGEGTCKVEGIKEGLGLVTLTVKTTDGEKLTEKVFISICTSLNQFQAKTTKATDVYRGASINSGVENDDKKDTISGNVQITLLSKCGNFYRFKTNDGSTFSDDSETGFIKSSAVKVLADSIKIKENDLSLKSGTTAGLTAEVLPDITADKSARWSSSDAQIAEINSGGKLTGKAEGTVKISAFTQDGTKKEDNIWVSVYSAMTKTAGYLNQESKLYKLADGKTVWGNAAAGETLAITGQSGVYYRVKMDKKSLYTDKSEDEHCYVLKSNVTIPVQSVAFSKKIVSIRMNQSVRLKTTVYPENASDKTLIYTSNNPLVAKVDSRGIVTAVKIGDADITTTTRDGKHIAVCSVYVSPQTDLTWSGSKTKNTKKKAAANGKITANGKNDSSILITWKKFKSVKRYELQRAKSGSKKYKTIKKLGKNKKKYVDKKVKFYQIYKYRLRITRTDGTKAYSKAVKARTKDSKVDIRLKAAGYRADSIKLIWNKQKNVKHYVIMRREGIKGEFEEIKKVSRKKTAMWIEI